MGHRTLLKGKCQTDLFFHNAFGMITQSNIKRWFYEGDGMNLDAKG